MLKTRPVPSSSRRPQYHIREHGCFAADAYAERMCLIREINVVSKDERWEKAVYLEQPRVAACLNVPTLSTIGTATARYCRTNDC